jgi:hypothetical protein
MNSILVSPNIDSVHDGIDMMLSSNFNSEIIRNNFLEKREKIDIPEIINMFNYAFNILKVDIDSKLFFFKYIFYKYIGNQWKCHLFKKVGI